MYLFVLSIKSNPHIQTAVTDYFRQRGYVIVIVCLLATLCKNFQTDLHEIFREGWPMNKWLNFDGDPDHISR